MVCTTITVLTGPKISVLDVSPDRTSLVIGESVTLTATLKNDGDQDGTATVKLLYNGSIVDSKSVTVPAGQSATVTFTHAPTEAGTAQYCVEI